jgi:hypothetical protein
MTKVFEMRKLLALMVLLCGTASTDAAEAQKWCSPEGVVIIQSEGAYLLDGKPVKVGLEHGNSEEDILVIEYDGMIFGPCGPAIDGDAEQSCEEFFPCP